MRQPDRGGRAGAAGSCWSVATPGGRRPRSADCGPSRRRRRVDSLLCDFGDQAAVRRLAADLLSTCDRIDVLVNNAGTVFARRTLTGDGIEATFAVNHLAGFLLTELLLDRICESAPARIVFTSSEGHYSGTLDLDDLGFERGYSVMRAYSPLEAGQRPHRARPGPPARRHRRHRDLAPPRRHRDQHLEPGAVVRAAGSGGDEAADGVSAGRRLAARLPGHEPRGRGADRWLLRPQPAARAVASSRCDDALGERLYDVSARLVGLAGSSA